MSADLDALLISLYVLVDDLLPARRRFGRPPRISDSELICLAIAQVLLDCPNERRFLRLAKQRLGHLFPYIPGQSGFNKRLRRLAPQLLEATPHRVLRNDTLVRWEAVGSPPRGTRPGEADVVATRDGSPVVRYSDAQPTRTTDGDIDAMALYAGTSGARQALPTSRKQSCATSVRGSSSTHPGAPHRRPACHARGKVTPRPSTRPGRGWTRPAGCSGSVGRGCLGRSGPSALTAVRSSERRTLGALHLFRSRTVR